MARSNNDYFDFTPSSVAVMERPPAAQARLISGLIMLFAIITISWLVFSKVDIIVAAQGKVVPAGNVKVIQAAEQGVVRDIQVRNGQLVKAGDPLIELDSTSSEADEQQLQIKRTKALLTVQRLRGELGESLILGEGVDNADDLIVTEKALMQANNNTFNEKISLLDNDRAQAESALASAGIEVEKISAKITHLARQLTNKRRQASNGLIAKQDVVDTQFEWAEANQEKAVLEEAMTDARTKLDASKEKREAAYVERTSELYKQLSQAEHELKSAQQDVIKAKQRMSHQVLNAPVDGVVQQLAVHTIGAVVTRADQLMVIVPDDTALEIEAQILNKDIGFVNTDQPAKVKIDAFEYTRYGLLEGDLQWVGGDAVVDEQKGPVYPVRIALATNTLPNKVNDKIARIVPGMSSSVDIVIGERRLIDYFIGPLLRYKDESLNER